jgi:hypothetical protein
MVENWKPVPGYEGLYDVSDLGNVRTYYAGRGRFAGRLYRAKPHKVRISRHGYPMTSLCKDGKTHQATVSRLVLMAFVGHPPPGRPYACHNNGQPANNRLCNLRWGSNAENQADRVTHGTSNRGAANGRAKFTEDDVRHIRSLLTDGLSQTYIAGEYGVDPSAISNIKRGRNWGHVA